MAPKDQPGTSIKTKTKNKKKNKNSILGNAATDTQMHKNIAKTTPALIATTTTTKKGGMKQAYELNGYTPLAITFTHSNSSANNNEPTHYIYVKRHVAPEHEENNGEAGRTLFAMNLPVDSNEQKLRALFKQIGSGTEAGAGACGCRVHRVVFNGLAGADVFMREASRTATSPASELADSGARGDDMGKPSKKKSKSAREKERQMKEQEKQRREQENLAVRFGSLVESGSSAHIVLLEPAELDLIFISAGSRNQKLRLKWPVGDDNTAENYLGLQRYLFEYRGLRPPQDLLRTELTNYMQKFEANVYEKQRVAQLASSGEPDEDGFVTVSYSKFKSSSTISAKDEYYKGKLQEKSDKTMLGNFYRWQQRENKKNDAVSLKQKFEQDKAKILSLRANRRFKPY